MKPAKTDKIINVNDDLKLHNNFNIGDTMPRRLKVCSKCGEAKPLKQFYRDRHSKDGLSYWCKTCMYKPKVKPKPD